MTSVEQNAKTREQAIDLALEELGAERHEVQVEILDGGSRGIFGIGARDVKVRVSLEEGVKPRRRAPAKKKQPVSEKKAGKPGRRTPPEEETGKAKKAPRTRRQPVENKRPPRQDAEDKRPPRRELPALGEDERNEAAALLGEIVAKMGLEATVTASDAEDNMLKLNIGSPDSAILIGRKGKNREALQYLINRMASGGEAPGAPDRIIVDVEDYLERRRETLQEMALGLAQKAKDTKRNMRVRPLSPQERRIVHVTLQDDPDIRTFSVGNSVNRCVMIAPKNAEPEQGRPRRQGGNRGQGRPRGPRQHGAKREEE